MADDWPPSAELLRPPSQATCCGTSFIFRFARSVGVMIRGVSLAPSFKIAQITPKPHGGGVSESNLEMVLVVSREMRGLTT